MVVLQGQRDPFKFHVYGRSFGGGEQRDCQGNQNSALEHERSSLIVLAEVRTLYSWFCILFIVAYFYQIIWLLVFVLLNILYPFWKCKKTNFSSCARKMLGSSRASAFWASERTHYEVGSECGVAKNLVMTHAEAFFELASQKFSIEWIP